MIRVITIDDEPLALKLLEVYIKRIPDIQLVASCPSAAAAIPYIKDADVLFVDINMPDVTGMEFVRSLQNASSDNRRPLVVFTTAYAQYAVEGFRVNAIDYLVKPFSFEEFSEAVDRVRHMLDLQSRPESDQSRQKTIIFQVGHQKRFVNISDILYIEGMGAYLRVHIFGDDPIVVLGNFRSIIDADPDRFFRIHKSYAINLGHIRQSGRASVTLTDGTTLSIGESYRKAFQDLSQKTTSHL